MWTIRPHVTHHQIYRLVISPSSSAPDLEGGWRIMCHPSPDIDSSHLQHHQLREEIEDSSDLLTPCWSRSRYHPMIGSDHVAKIRLPITHLIEMSRLSAPGQLTYSRFVYHVRAARLKTQQNYKDIYNKT